MGGKKGCDGGKRENPRERKKEKEDAIKGKAASQGRAMQEGSEGGGHYCLTKRCFLTRGANRVERRSGGLECMGKNFGAKANKKPKKREEK